MWYTHWFKSQLLSPLIDTQVITTNLRHGGTTYHMDYLGSVNLGCRSMVPRLGCLGRHRTLLCIPFKWNMHDVTWSALYTVMLNYLMNTPHVCIFCHRNPLRAKLLNTLFHYAKLYRQEIESGNIYFAAGYIISVDKDWCLQQFKTHVRMYDWRLC